MRVIGYLESSFWTMREAEFGAMMRVAYAHAEKLDSILARDVQTPETMLKKPGTPLAGTRYVSMRDSVAVIEVNGAIAKRMSMFAEMCYGGTSTETLMKDFSAAIDSPDVSSIVLHIDSPGGEAFGINELADSIYQARGKKPIKAYVSGLGCSGAYWIATAADEIITDKSAFLGSIGVVTAWMDDKKFYESMGIRREVVTSTNAPLKRLDFDNDEHRAELQKELDSLEKGFHKSVARNLKISVETIKSDFNKGGVLSGVDAVKVGMAHRTGSLEGVIKELQTKKRKTSAVSAEGDFDMGFKEEFKSFAAKLGFSVEESEPPTDYSVTVEGSPEEKRLLAEKQAAEVRATQAQAELDKVKAEQAEKAKAQIETEADVFIAAECKAGRLTPAQKDTFKSLFVQAAADDNALPLAEGSRLQTLKNNQSKQFSHGLTDEHVDAEANEGFILALGDSKTKLDKQIDAQADNYVATVQPKFRVVGKGE